TDGSLHIDNDPYNVPTNPVTAIGLFSTGMYFGGTFIGYNYNFSVHNAGRIAKLNYCYSLVENGQTNLISKDTTELNTLKSSFNAPAYTYPWYKCSNNEVVKESNEPFFTYTEIGNYGLEIHYGNG